LSLKLSTPQNVVTREIRIIQATREIETKEEPWPWSG
jgi:hypothetical protein